MAVKPGPGRHCGWCGKPGGTCLSMLKQRCDAAGVTLKGQSQRYFHPGKCVERTRRACDQKEAEQRTAEMNRRPIEDHHYRRRPFGEID